MITEPILTITEEQVDYNPDLVVEDIGFVHYKYVLGDGKNSMDLFGSVPTGSKEHHTLDEIRDGYLKEIRFIRDANLDFEIWKGQRFDIWNKVKIQQLHMCLYSRFKWHLKQYRKFVETFGEEML